MNPEVKRIIREMGGALNVSYSDIMGRRRFRRIVEARWFCWYSLWLRGYGQQEIGRIWNVHHTAVTHATQRIRFWIDSGEHHTKHLLYAIGWLLTVHSLRYRYKVSLRGDVLVESARPLEPASIRERALAGVERGECQFAVANTDASEIKPKLKEAA